MNTKDGGIAQIKIFPYYKKRFLAVCLDFDIIEELDTLEEARQSIEEAVTGYIETVRQVNFSDDLLNRPASKIYWKRLDYTCFFSILWYK